MSMVGDSDGRSSDRVDAEFAQIVAGFNATPTAGETPWPMAEDLPPAEKAPARPWSGPVWPVTGPVLNPREPDESILDALDRFGAHLPDEDDEPFVPQPPLPLPRFSLQAILGAIGVIVGLILFFNNDILPIDGQETMLIGLVLVIGGAIALILRLRPGGPDDDDLPDDGAVV